MDYNSRVINLVQMKGDCYPDLVEVFYPNLRVLNEVIHSRVKGVNIAINDDVWLLVVGLKAKGYWNDLKEELKYIMVGMQKSQPVNQKSQPVNQKSQPINQKSQPVNQNAEKATRVQKKLR
ncbi:hypothetical protein LR48_Vigan08g100700 [Vigna angularis]|uniref:Uncharacterized protein n=1 Tax=Phaseolus angularis TaxID=3914 RepID=A0A0L9V509_PHAAN|nr:hypothetical protein LR48_Vigan08g100700 [Vigna angularis]